MLIKIFIFLYCYKFNIKYKINLYIRLEFDIYFTPLITYLLITNFTNKIQSKIISIETYIVLKKAFLIDRCESLLYNLEFQNSKLTVKQILFLLDNI